MLLCGHLSLRVCESCTVHYSILPYYQLPVQPHQCSCACLPTDEGVAAWLHFDLLNFQPDLTAAVSACHRVRGCCVHCELGAPSPRRCASSMRRLPSLSGTAADTACLDAYTDGAIVPHSYCASTPTSRWPSSTGAIAAGAPGSWHSGSMRSATKRKQLLTPGAAAASSTPASWLGCSTPGANWPASRSAWQPSGTGEALASADNAIGVQAKSKSCCKADLRRPNHRLAVFAHVLPNPQSPPPAASPAGTSTC